MIRLPLRPNRERAVCTDESAQAALGSFFSYKLQPRKAIHKQAYLPLCCVTLRGYAVAHWICATSI